MTADLEINGKDALTTWGVRMGSGFLDAIDSFNEMKDFVSDESRLEHGKRVVVENPKVKSREITLQFTIQGASESEYRERKNLFQKELEKGNVTIKVPALGNVVFKLIYLGKNISYGLSLTRSFGKISCKFEEPNPMDRSES